MIKSLRYTLEGFGLSLLFYFFKILPPQTASNIGGWLGGTIGPKLAASRKAYHHLSMALPDTTKEEQKKIIRGMWENLGRVIAEYPHLETISREYTTIEGAEIFENLLTRKQPAIFIGPHMANWEVNCMAAYTQLNNPIDITYRAPNNPWTARLLEKARTLNGKLKAYQKSQESGIHIMRAMKENHMIGILIDQKYNEGLEAEFFGMPAMTNPIFVKLCQRFKCPLVPVRNIRQDGCHVKLKIYDPIPVFDEKGNPREIIDVIEDAHRLLESWITENPEQWMWLHRRWKS
ncbi:MAG: lipid A biosynthesis acyltransferase [Alphaproteobacteria bacterium]|nr:lipid A biosynthesis acyltransferase [Alphaproteobacteria bacterium]